MKTKDVEKCDVALSNAQCVDTKVLLFSSVLFGLIGGDRFYLGNKKLGIIKCATFFSLLIGIIAVLMVITYRVFESIKGFVGAITITWTDNVAIVGNGLAYSMYILMAGFALYFVVVIIYAFVCRKKAQKSNLTNMLQVLETVD